MIAPEDERQELPQENEAESESDDVGSEEEAKFVVERITIKRRNPGRRLDKTICGRIPRLSRTLVQKLIKQGEVTVNGKKSKCSYEPGDGDEIEIRVPPPEPMDVVPEDIPVEIVYEDDHILAINKHTGIICHPSRPGQTGTIANALAFYAGQNLSHGDDPFRPGIVHRLDKNTTGVMLIAKHDEAHWRLSLQFEKRTTQKTYFGILEGNPTLDGDIINQPLAAHPMIKDRYIVLGLPTKEMLFKEAITRYQVIERFVGFSLVHMFPKTGRTHQLRVHMSSIGHPMLGDTQYGGHFFSEKQITGEGSDEPLIPHQSLHAFRIEFKHPILEKPMCIEAPLPDNITHIVDLLRKHRSKKK